MASLNKFFNIVQSGFSSNSRVRLQMNNCLNSSIKFQQSRSIGIESFFYIIFSYFSFLVFALRFCQGTAPLMKQSSTLAIPSMSSLLPCSIPRWVLSDANLAVPVRFLLSLYGMWALPSLSTYFLASPKSIMQILFDFLPQPTTKLSGLTSLCIKVLLWMYSILSIIWYPTISVVFRSNFLPVWLKRSYNDFPQRSITITLYSPSQPTQQTFGKPWSVEASSPFRDPNILPSQKSCGLLLEAFSSFTAYSV